MPKARRGNGAAATTARRTRAGAFDGLQAVVDIELAVDVLEMNAGCASGDERT